MQEHLRRFGTLVERGIKSGLPEFATDTARCDILVGSLPYSLKDIRRDFHNLPSDKQTFRALHAMYLEEMRAREVSETREKDAASNGNILYAGKAQRGRGGGRGRGGFRGRGGRNNGAPKEEKQHGGKGTAPGSCWNCGKPGHWRIDCPEPSKKEKGTAATAACHGCRTTIF
ncbi:hypothetical protein M231_07756 [Tremella mesenterica]|uniref:CCHC-type domain-containing protein n=1 Tax=Tremella mesenterica TaxID=5217 RepID=A0A4Q1BFM8_TREME|nr:hypothetical protein M231_07756 [Tremella mesenterica]